MASLRYVKGKGYRIEWCVTVKHGPHKGQRVRGSQLISYPRDTKANRTFAEQVRKKREAEAIQLAAGMTVPMVKWPDFLDEYCREKAYNKTIGIAIGRLKELGEFGNFKTVEDFTGHAITRFIDQSRKNGTRPPTIRKILGDFSAAMTYAFNKQYVKDHPFKLQQITMPPKAKPRDRFITRDDFAAFLKMCRSMPDQGGMTGQDRKFAMDFAWHAVFVVNTGLRITEYIIAKRSDLYADRLTVHGKGKRGQLKTRTIPLNRQARQALKHIGQKKGELVFPFCNRRNWRIKYLRWFGRAGVENVTPHVLRRTFGSWLAMSGVPLSAIAQLMGHANIQTTIDAYIQLTPGFLQNSTSNMRYHIK